MNILETAKDYLSLFELTWQQDKALCIIHDLLIQFDNYKSVLEQEKRLAEARGISRAETATAEACAQIADRYHQRDPVHNIAMAIGDKIRTDFKLPIE